MQRDKTVCKRKTRKEERAKKGTSSTLFKNQLWPGLTLKSYLPYYFFQNVINQFSTLAEGSRCSFIGNVNVGKDISVEQLLQAYDIVIMVSTMALWCIGWSIRPVTWGCGFNTMPGSTLCWVPEQDSLLMLFLPTQVKDNNHMGIHAGKVKQTHFAWGVANPLLCVCKLDN